MNKKPFGNTPKKVNKIDLKSKKVIETFNSISQASKSIGKNSYSSIYACLNGQINTAYGYGWEYE